MKGQQPDVVDDVCRITLPPILDIPAAADLRETILETVESEMTIVFQADAVEQVTTPGIQMLMAAAAFIERKKARLTMAKPSDELIDGFSELGLFPQLMSWNLE